MATWSMPGAMPQRGAMWPPRPSRSIAISSGRRWNVTQVISEAHATMAVTTPVPLAIPRTAGVLAEMCPGQRTLGSQGQPDNQSDHVGSYSWLWWINGVRRTGARLWPDAPADTFGAFGHGGARAMYVVPSLGLVVSYNDATTADWHKVNEGMRLLMTAVSVWSVA